MNKNITVVLDTTQQAAKNINSIYALDVIVALEVERGEHTILINEPSAELLAQLYTKRARYNYTFRIA